METLSTIKADTGGFVGHSAVHPPMMTYAQQRLDEVKGLPTDRRAGRQLRRRRRHPRTHARLRERPVTAPQQETVPTPFARTGPSYLPSLWEMPAA